MKTKIKSHGDEVAEFYDKEIWKLDSNHTCLAEISLDSALNKDRNYYLQVFLKACKYIKKKIIRHNMNHLEGSSNDSDDSDNSNKEEIKATMLIFLEKPNFEGAILKIYSVCLSS